MGAFVAGACVMTLVLRLLVRSSCGVSPTRVFTRHVIIVGAGEQPGALGAYRLNPPQFVWVLGVFADDAEEVGLASNRYPIYEPL